VSYLDKKDSPKPAPGVARLMFPCCISNPVRLQEYLENARLRLRLHDEVFEIAIAEPGQEFKDDFAVINYRGEKTVVRPVRRETTNGIYRMITVDAELPSDLVGLLAFLSEGLAKAEVPIFVVSSLRTDHILVRQEDLARSVRALKALGADLVGAGPA